MIPDGEIIHLGRRVTEAAQLRRPLRNELIRFARAIESRTLEIIQAEFDRRRTAETLEAIKARLEKRKLEQLEAAANRSAEVMTFEPLPGLNCSPLFETSPPGSEPAARADSR